MNCDHCNTEFDYLNGVRCPDCGSDMFFIFGADEDGHVTEFSSFECLDCGKHYGDVVITFAPGIRESEGE